jgi:hypothetical protein
MQEDQHTQATAVEHFDVGQVENHHAWLFQAGHGVSQEVNCLPPNDSSGTLQHGHVTRLLALDVQ